jgi:hypothetical protein
MILYLSSEENIGLFDFLIEENFIIKKYNGTFDLKRFIVHDARNIDPYRYFVVDLEAIDNSDDEIIESIIAFYSLFNSRIIILAEKANRELVERIINETNTFNIITSNEIDKMLDEIRICISSRGMTKDMVINKLNKNADSQFVSNYSFVGENVKITIAGSQNRVGTTTIALNIASYLASMGAKVSYTEANTNNHLRQIHSYYFKDVEIENNCFTVDNINYFLNGCLPEDNYNFNIIDVGAITENNIKLFIFGNVKVLCGGSKPYELPKLLKSFQLINNEDINIITPGQDINNIINIDKENLYNINYSCDLFNNCINTNVWRSVLSDYIVEAKTL